MGRKRKAKEKFPSVTNEVTKKETRPKRPRGRQLPRKFDIIIGEVLEPNDRHPLFGLSAEQRERSRIAALGSILANLALRKVAEASKEAGPHSPEER